MIKYLPESVLADYLCLWVIQCYTVSTQRFNYVATSLSNKITPPDMKADFMRSVSTLPENLVTLIKKSNIEINLVDGALKAGDLKQYIPDPVPGS